MEDVANHASVSKSTVSQFLNQRYEYMAGDTKKRIEKAIQTLGYNPNYVARSLKQKKTLTIGIIVANILHRFSTMAIRAIEDFCYEKDYNTIVCNADDDPLKERRYIQLLRAKQVDGLIIIPTEGNYEIYDGMQKEDFPVVFMDRKINGLTIPTITIENREAASRAVQHFYDLGHHRIGMLTPPLNISTRQERVEGFIKGYRLNNLVYDEKLIRNAEVEQVANELEKMLNLSDPPTAILSGNDLVLIEILSYAKKYDVKIPGDLALITFDDVTFANFYYPSLTTIAQPAYEMGEAAADQLIKRMKVMNYSRGANQDGNKIEFASTLVVRESCGS
ncbi:LacI family transcriptional regulator [Salicibibacter halophilus]|uniref:LacI family transcriptional regulator n=1 Tax=Salicibibacter halophilus TaxID=2502791 RepID=A0A514LL25_9BACI|nr:substrate-binding domain-containing protein [Salicibibacter halophilus]QDI92562.1 LacI family transcriptional regulator [Salicibibacter halophilus]